MKYLCVLAVILFALQPALASAQRGGGMRGGGGARMGGGARPSGGARAPGGGGGFNFSHDTGRAPQSRPQGGNLNNGNRNNGNLNNGNRNANNHNYNRNNANNPNYNRNNANNPNYNRNNANNPNYNRNNANYNRTNTNYNRTTVNNYNRNVSVNGNTYIRNPVYGGGAAWGWNHGVAWAPAPYYWGGGFWGAMAVGVASAAVYGSIVSNNVTYNSYQVQPSTPGYTFLSNYQLTQVQCGPSGLVVVYGPQNSVICANPNQHVAAGSYQLNTETLSLAPM